MISDATSTKIQRGCVAIIRMGHSAGSLKQREVLAIELPSSYQHSLKQEMPVSPVLRDQSLSGDTNDYTHTLSSSSRSSSQMGLGGARPPYSI